MRVELYVEYYDKIVKADSWKQAEQMYNCLLNIFIQDCSLPIKQEYFGNVTKAKAKILFNLQGLMINKDKETKAP